MQIKIFIKTFGCQMNVADSEQLVKVLMTHKKYNFDITNNITKADLIIINTCCVRENVEQKIFSIIGKLLKLKNLKKELIIGIGGCMVQKNDSYVLQKIKGIDFIFGTRNIHNVPNMLDRVIEKKSDCIINTDFNENFYDYFLYLMNSNQQKKILKINKKNQYVAFVNIMTGCNNYCSYCIVPYVRGPEISRKKNDILNEIKYLIDYGIKEIILLGQNVNAYGKIFSEKKAFSRLLKEIGKISEINRIRFLTSHPKDLTKDIIDCFSEIKNLCEHIHLPVQSGSDKILKLMNRNYTIIDFKKKIDQLRLICPKISITTDFIVGFPNENHQDFKQTLNLIKEINFNSSFSFKYSNRPLTFANNLKNQVNDLIKEKRLKILQNLQKECTLKINKTYKNKIEEIMVEEINNKQNQNIHILSGKTRSNVIVNFQGEKNLIGKIVPVKIIKTSIYALEGKIFK